MEGCIKLSFMHGSGPQNLPMCYEHGPTSFGLARHLGGLLVTCAVVAPGLIPQKAADWAKTVRLDAQLQQSIGLAPISV